MGEGSPKNLPFFTFRGCPIPALPILPYFRLCHSGSPGPCLASAISKIVPMTEQETHIKADMILELLCRPGYENGMFDSRHLRAEIFPDLDVESIEYVMNWAVKNHYPEVAELESGIYIMKTVNTAAFMRQGGYTRKFADQVAEAARAKEIEDLNLEKSRVELELSKKTLNDYNRTRALSWAAFIISLALAVVQIIKWINGE